MTSPSVKSVVVAVVSIGFAAANLVPFTKTTTSTCPGGNETYVTQTSNRGFPFSYWSKSSMDYDYPPCEFSGLTAATTFMTQSIFLNLLVGGAVLVGTHIALDYRRGKK
jgi:hypothetical protein